MTIATSYSTLTNFEKCPQKVKLQKIDKIDDGLDSVEAIIVGKKMHEDLEDWLNAIKKGEEYEYPERAEKIHEAIDNVIEKAGLENCIAEKKYAFSKDFKNLVDFFDKSVWLRAVIDLDAEKDNKAYLIDYKSGKYSTFSTFSYMGQLQLYAVIKMMTSPHIDEVHTSLFYAKDGKVLYKIYRRKNLPSLLKLFTDRLNKLFFATDFPAKPTKSNCKFCNYSEKHCDYAHES